VRESDEQADTDNGLRIDPEIHALIPPLLKEEREHLRESLLRDGCRDRIVAWDEEDRYLLDGHNRQELCEELGIGYGKSNGCHSRTATPRRRGSSPTSSAGATSAMQRVNLALKLEPLIAAKQRAHESGGGTLAEFCTGSN
jgi:hypothetical protein